MRLIRRLIAIARRPHRYDRLQVIRFAPFQLRGEHGEELRLYRDGKEALFRQGGYARSEEELEAEVALADAVGEQAAVAQDIGEVGEDGAVVLGEGGADETVVEDVILHGQA